MEKTKILLIDDEELLLETMAMMLEKDFVILSCNNIHCGLDMVQNHPDITAILCDISFPEVDGLEFHRELVRRKSPLINRLTYLSGGPADQISTDYIHQNNLKVLYKPVQISDLKKYLRDQ